MQNQVFRTIFGILIGALFMYLTLKGQDVSSTIEKLKHANIIWLVVSGFILLLVFIFRAYRWNIMLDNLGYKIKNSHIVYYTLFGYLINSFTPKFGEVLRCTALASDADIPVAKSFGSVIMERVYDVLVLFIGLGIILLLEYKRLGNMITDGLSEKWIEVKDNSSFIIIALLVILGMTILGFFLLRKLGFYTKVKNFVSELITSVKDSIRMKNFGKFFFYTVIIWVLLALLNYAILLAMPETNNLSFYFAIVVLFVGGLGWALPSPGGVGTTNYIILQLFIVFSLSEEVSVAFGILSNAVLFVFTVLFGLIAVLIKYMSKSWEPKIA